MSALLILGVILAGCRRFDVGPTPVPTQSPTPRSTALPVLPTEVPVGSEASPIQMVVFSRNETASETDISAFENELIEATGLTMDVRMVERPADALAALCASPQGPTSIVVVDGLTALAAEAQGCGDMAIVFERTVGNLITSVQDITIISAQEVGTISDLSTTTFCRVGAADMETWLYPSILLRANGIDVADIETYVEVASPQEAAEAVAAGDCDAAGVASETVAAMDEEVRDSLFLLTPSLSIAYGILIYPEQVNLNARTAIDDALVALVGNPQSQSVFQAITSADDVRPITDEDTEELRDVLADADLDLAQIGR